jgi:esterase/lipase
VACEYLDITSRTLAAMPDMEFDFIVFHSEDDGLCDPDGSRRLFASSKANSKMLSIVNQFWHNLTEEEGNEDLQSAVISWTDTMIQQAFEG